MTDQLGAPLIAQIQFSERLSTGVLEVEPLIKVGEGPVIDIHKAQHCNLSAPKDFESDYPWHRRTHNSPGKCGLTRVFSLLASSHSLLTHIYCPSFWIDAYIRQKNNNHGVMAKRKQLMTASVNYGPATIPQSIKNWAGDNPTCKNTSGTVWSACYHKTSQQETWGIQRGCSCLRLWDGVSLFWNTVGCGHYLRFEHTRLVSNKFSLLVPSQK